MSPLSPYALGATLYMPATRGDIAEVALGLKHPGLASVAICLEDALAEADVQAGLDHLRRALAVIGQANRAARRPLVFVRPRSLDMARAIASWPVAGALDGFVAPKFRPGHASRWFEAVAGTSLHLMPTLETADMFDPFAVRDVRDELLGFDRRRILALRIGGNDLLACLGLRRVRSMTVYEGPLAPTIAMLVGTFAAAGFRLTAPVFDILDDAPTLARELQRDVSFGFVGKTAIHPSQIAGIRQAFAVERTDYESARHIMSGGAAAVFKMHGAMCEPATHRNWAERVLEQADQCGIRGEGAAALGREGTMAA